MKRQCSLASIRENIRHLGGCVFKTRPITIQDFADAFGVEVTQLTMAQREAIRISALAMSGNRQCLGMVEYAIDGPLKD